MRCGVCKRVDATISVEHVRACRGIATTNDVVELLQQSSPPFHLLLDGIAISKREERHDLRDRCIDTALAAVTGETPKRDVRYVVKAASHRLLEHSKDSNIRADVETARAKLAELSTLNQALAPIAREEQQILDEIALTLDRATSPAYVTAASRLRRMNRPDLALVVADRAIWISPSKAPPRTTKAGALVDLQRPAEGLVEADLGEGLEPSGYTANALSRAHRCLRDYPAVIESARLAIQRQPDAPRPGWRALLVAAIDAEDTETAAEARVALESANPSIVPSAKYFEFLSALELHKTGSKARAIAVLQRLTDDGYPPARRALLRFGSGATTAREDRKRP